MLAATPRSRHEYTNWAELRFGERLKLWAKKAKKRIRAKYPEREPEVRAKERRQCVYYTLTESEYSTLAQWVGLFLGLCIMLSTVAFVLETIPEYERAPGWGTYFFYAECFFVAVFTIELALKFWSFPHKTKKFVKDPLNVIDVLSILPFYIEVFMAMIIGSSVAMLDLRILRAFRLMRMLKMGRFSGDLQLLGQGLYRARMSFALLCGTLILGTLFFSTLMWMMERGTWNSSKQCWARPDEVFFNGCSPFESVPLGFWWAITTMTTVGYGDTFPITPIGKFIAGIAMLAGIFCVALPTGILCTEFSKLFAEQQVSKKKTAITTELRHRPKVELELFLEGEKLHKAQIDLDEQLLYMKRLAYLYVEVSNGLKPDDVEHVLMLDPMYTAFQTKAVNALDSMMNYVLTVSNGLAVQHYTAVFSGREKVRRLLSGAPLVERPEPETQPAATSASTQ
jgi:hypothetical protein